MIAIFDNNDSEYSAWLLANPSGYVVNMRHGYSPSYMVLHRSSCAAVNPRTSSSEPGAFTERDYLKVCGADLESLRSLAKAFGRPDGSFSAECSKCSKHQRREKTVHLRRTAAPSLNSNVRRQKSMESDFSSIFRKLAAPTARAKYLSRVFGIFSEEIVRVWANHPRSPYEDLGRPTLRKRGEKSGSTLDFTLRQKNTGKAYVAELKCEIEYQNFKYLVLSETKQLDHHNKAAFFALLDAAAKSTDQHTFVNGRELQIDGAILIWGDATPEGRRAVIEAKGFFDILIIDEIIRDLRTWQCESFRQLVEQKRSWTNEMFDAFIQ